ncbi:hypothetical protein BD289DRAFT_367971 [Coniella lustricola]|uniref:EGF domain-specific O-linked N-acetylglucosamine transferase n=1 Tax=Coniella lustricola TaxID=2025994 RepID=A0A2T3A8M6_9PEZI|nr:hypothetical protein BD289DRAFT_367971 [Coniella lustricola]
MYTASTTGSDYVSSPWSRPEDGFTGSHQGDDEENQENHKHANLPSSSPVEETVQSASTASSSTPWDIPDDYYAQASQNQPSTCEQRFGPAYLEELRHTRAAYCSPDSPSQLTCFHNNNNGFNNKDGRTDSFCIAQGAVFDQETNKFQVQCDTVPDPWGVETNAPSLKLQSFWKYWYDTGPRIVMDRALALVASKDDGTHERTAGVSRAPLGRNNKFTILLKREGELNPWHCILEILSLTFSMDVLRMTPQQYEETAEETPFWTLADAENTQVVILDERHDGPYFDLWQLFAKRPIVRIGELPSSNEEMSNVIIPLPGASNPLWQGDWEPNPCRHSVLLKTFSWRVLRHYAIPDTLEAYGDSGLPSNSEDKDKVVVTFIDRRGQRKLVDMDGHIAALRDRYEDNGEQHVVIHVVDLAALPFPEQVKLVRNSDVLAGVHGAGLTHGLWMKEHSAMVEILPEDLNHKGFRNFAGVLGHDYFSTHGSKVADSSGNWQHDDVRIDVERFLEMMDLAIKSMYNKGRLNYDVI